MNGAVAHAEPGPPNLPRKITIERASEGYGFNLHGEKGIHGQFISAIDDGSPAQKNDLRLGDRVIAVNDEDVEDFSHSKVVERIRAGGNRVTLLVVDRECDEYYKNLGAKIPQDKYEIPSVRAPVANVENEVGEENKENCEEKVNETETVAEASNDVATKQVEGNPELDEQDNNEEVSTTKVSSGEKHEEAATEEARVSPSAREDEESSKLDMAAARPKPKRHDVKRATQNWKQKYDDFNKL